MKPNLQAFFDPATWTVTYMVPPPEDDGRSYLKIPLNAL